MRSLLDVNVLIALFDPDHVFHERAHIWWAAHASEGCATCAITENGFVRIMSQPTYSARVRFSPTELIERLATFAQQTSHVFWADSISLRDTQCFARDRIHSSRQITDIYLLALAASRGGRLATFDEGVPVSAVLGARTANLAIV
jgi:uncharacterized protein